MLDIDSTDDRVHGRQEGHAYHGYYGHHCLLPLHVFCGPHPLCAVLRPGNSDPAAGAVEQLARIVGRLRRRWPGLGILVRADSAFASILMAALRRALAGTGLARATAGTLRLKLLKIGARVMVSARRVRIAMDSAHPSAPAFARVHARLSG